LEINVAIFEDNKLLRESLQQLIDNEEGLACTGAFADACRLIGNMEMAHPDVVMMDIDMPGISGIEAVQIIKEKFPGVHKY
jgi:DNA-binding NarL/FixJ family response regulator